MGWTERIKKFDAESWAILAKNSKWAIAWFAILAVGCVALWRGAPPSDGFGRAQAQAATVVEMNLSAEATPASLAKVMTEEAAKRAVADRAASGLDEALAAAGSRMMAKATPLSVSKAGSAWVVKGVASAELEKASSSSPVAWRGAWSAVLETDAAGILKVSKLNIASLPEGARMDESALTALPPPPPPIVSK